MLKSSSLANLMGCHTPELPIDQPPLVPIMFAMVPNIVKFYWYMYELLNLVENNSFKLWSQ